MAPNERLDELAALLAAGFQRHLIHERKGLPVAQNSQNQLDALRGAEAPCGSRVPSPQSTRPPA